jgi:hypothetical protein
VCFVEYVPNISAEPQYHSAKVVCFDDMYKRVSGGSECQNVLAVGMHVLLCNTLNVKVAGLWDNRTI